MSLAERCDCCGRSLPQAGDPAIPGDIPVGGAWLRGRMLVPNYGLTVRLTPKQQEIMSLLARRPAGVLALVLAAAIKTSENSLKVQIHHLRHLLEEADCGLALPLQPTGRGNHALYRLKIDKDSDR